MSHSSQADPWPHGERPCREPRRDLGKSDLRQPEPKSEKPCKSALIDLVGIGSYPEGREFESRPRYQEIAGNEGL
jgi:hypothetical protein